MTERELQRLEDDLKTPVIAVNVGIARALIKDVRERDAVIADLQQDRPAFDLGRKAGHDEALAILRDMRSRYQKQTTSYPGIGEPEQGGLVNLGRIQACNEAIDALLAEAKLRSGERHGLDHPGEVRRECERLRAALSRIADGTIPDGNTAAFHAAVVLKER